MVVDEHERVQSSGDHRQMTHEIELPQRIRLGMLESGRRQSGQGLVRINEAMTMPLLRRGKGNLPRRTALFLPFRKVEGGWEEGVGLGHTCLIQGLILND